MKSSSIMELVFPTPNSQEDFILEKAVENPKELWTYQESDSRGFYKVSGCAPPPNDGRYSFPIASMPKAVLRNVFNYLKLGDCYSLLSAVPYSMIEDLLVEKIETLNKAISFSDNFYWSRDVGNYKWDHIANRVGHNMTYLPLENAMYIFGGGNIDGSGSGRDNQASFNDLWKLDLTTMKCERVFIRSAPYPLPKYQSVMLAYNKTLILHGGRQALRSTARKRTDFSSNEMHQFHPVHKSWTRFQTSNAGPRLSDHCGVIQSNTIIYYGGYTEKHDISTCFHILNLNSRAWSSATMKDVPTHYTSADYSRLQFSPELFPPYEPGTYSLISLRPGFLLLFGEPSLQHLSYNFAVLVEFNPCEPCNAPWKWRTIKITGKFNDFSVDNSEIPPSISANTRHPKVVAIQSKTAVRLVSLGLPRNSSKDLNFEVDQVSKQKFQRIQRFLTKLSEKMLWDLENVYNSAEKKSSDLYFSFDGISLKFVNFLVNLGKLTKKKKFDISDVQLRLDMMYPTRSGAPFDLVDLYEIRRMISEQAERLHLNRQLGYCIQAEVGLYSTAKLVTYSAIFDTSGDFQNFFEIDLKEGEPHTLSSPALFRYEMCPTEVDIVVMGGSHFKRDSNESNSPVTGYIYTLTPSFPRGANSAGSEKS